MDIHINISRVYFEIDKVRNLFAGRNQLLISLHHRPVEVRMAHIASVDKEVLMSAFLAGCLRFGDVAGDFHHGGIHLYIK